MPENFCCPGLTFFYSLLTSLISLLFSSAVVQHVEQSTPISCFCLFQYYLLKKFKLIITKLSQRTTHPPSHTRRNTLLWMCRGISSRTLGWFGSLRSHCLRRTPRRWQISYSARFCRPFFRPKQSSAPAVCKYFPIQSSDSIWSFQRKKPAPRQKFIFWSWISGCWYFPDPPRYGSRRGGKSIDLYG